MTYSQYGSHMMQQYLQPKLKQLNLLFEFWNLKNTHFTIFSNSLSCLQSLHNMNIDHPYDPSSISYIYHQVVEEGKLVNSVGFPAISAFLYKFKMYYQIFFGTYVI